MTNFYGGYHISGWNSWGSFLDMGWGGVFAVPFAIILILWTLYWKYRSLWHAAKHDHKWWFIALLVTNTVGILEIFYLYFFSKKADMPRHDESKTPMTQPQKEGPIS